MDYADYKLYLTNKEGDTLLFGGQGAVFSKGDEVKINEISGLEYKARNEKVYFNKNLLLPAEKVKELKRLEINEQNRLIDESALNSQFGHRKYLVSKIYSEISPDSTWLNQGEISVFLTEL